MAPVTVVVDELPGAGGPLAAAGAGVVERLVAGEGVVPAPALVREADDERLTDESRPGWEFRVTLEARDAVEEFGLAAGCAAGRDPCSGTRGSGWPTAGEACAAGARVGPGDAATEDEDDGAADDAAAACSCARR